MAMQIEPIQSLEGLWTFEIPEGDGAGVVVIANHQIHGGDRDFYFTGTYTDNGGEIEADISSHRFHGSSPAVLGPPNGGRFVVIGRFDAARTVLELWHREAGRMLVVLKQRLAFRA